MIGMFNSKNCLWLLSLAVHSDVGSGGPSNGATGVCNKRCLECRDRYMFQALVILAVQSDVESGCSSNSAADRDSGCAWMIEMNQFCGKARLWSSLLDV